MEVDIKRGDIWLGHLGQTKGWEQGGKRPLLVISSDRFNQHPANLFVVLPTTTRDRDMPWHVSVAPPEGGLDRNSFIMCEQTRTVTTGRLFNRLGALSAATMQQVEDRLRLLLDL